MAKEEVVEDSKIKAEVEALKNEEPVIKEVETPEEKVVPEKDYAVLAKEKGWRPKEEYEGDPEEWVDAKEFVDREPLYKAIHKSKREIKKLKEAQTEFRKHYDKVEQVAKEKAIKELRSQFETASEERDVKTAIEVHNKIKELEKEEPASATNEVFDEWVVENEWYHKDAELRKEATEYGYYLNGKSPETPIEEIYQQVSKFIKKAYPDKFQETTSKPKVTTVDAGGSNATVSNTTAKKKSITMRDLPEEARNVAKKLIRSGTLTQDEYLRDYAQSGGPLSTAE